MASSSPYVPLPRSSSDAPSSKDTSCLNTDDKNKPNSETITTLIENAVKTTLVDEDYSHDKVPDWHAKIVDVCLKNLKENNRNYKYIVTCVIMQNNGAGFYAGSSVYWDNQHDGSVSYRHQTKSLYAIVNVFWLSV